MTSSERAAIIHRNRPRGIYIPTDDVSAHLANGWKLLDDCPGYDEVLLAPPAVWEREAA
jgi:hypothetical protein